MSYTKIIIAILIVLGIAALVFSLSYRNSNNDTETTNPPKETNQQEEQLVEQPDAATPQSPEENNEPNNNPQANPSPNNPTALQPPINNANSRVTTKPFGLRVSPNNSPVSPERFSGYHTGTDFEILPGEENSAVEIFAICNGPLLQKRTASGYGGLAVQACTINNQAVTVVYGHLQLSSINAGIGEQLAAGQTIGQLGAGNSPATDGERKHLHLGIHKGSQANIAGYVSNQSALNNWINYQDLGIWKQSI